MLRDRLGPAWSTQRSAAGMKPQRGEFRSLSLASFLLRSLSTMRKVCAVILAVLALVQLARQVSAVEVFCGAGL